MKKKFIYIPLVILGVILTIVVSLMLFAWGVRRNRSAIPYYAPDISLDELSDSSSIELESYGKEDSYSATQEEYTNKRENVESKVQKEGSISILVEDLDIVIESIKVVNREYFGQITNINDSGRGNDRVVQLTVKVPVNEFEAYYEELRELEGEVTYANISTVDVTEEYIDITSQLTNLRNTEAQLTKVLEKAETVTDILTVQKELNTTRGQIEILEQRKRYFESRTDYSHMVVTLRIDKTGLSVTDDQWKPWGEVRVAVKALLNLLMRFGNLIIWLVVFSPLVLIPVFVIRYFVRKRKTKK
jgi:hypothetical protein